jgi:hypothetical protein
MVVIACKGKCLVKERWGVGFGFILGKRGDSLLKR